MICASFIYVLALDYSAVPVIKAPNCDVQKCYQDIFLSTALVLGLFCDH